MNFNNKKIAIIGLGLMGGSLGMALKKRFKKMKVYGVSRSNIKIRTAVKNNVIDSGTCDVCSLLENECIDIIFIATPVSVIKDFIQKIDRYAHNNIIVSDLGSTKAKLMRWVSHRKFKHINFVGCHPMAGSHQSGLDAAQIDLYCNSFCFITRTPKEGKRAFNIICGLWKALGVRTVIVDPYEHDKIVAKVSHFPHAVASLIVDTISRNSTDIFKFVGPGFLDATRIAQSSPSLWVDIFQSNKSNVIKEMKHFRRRVDSFISILKSKNIKRLKTFLTRVNIQRQNI